MDLDEAVEKGLIEYIGREIDDKYNQEILNMAINEDIDKDIKLSTPHSTEQEISQLEGS